MIESMVFSGNGALLARKRQTLVQLILIEWFTPAVTLDDPWKAALCRFIGCKALIALEALASAAYLVTLSRKA